METPDAKKRRRQKRRRDREAALSGSSSNPHAVCPVPPSHCAYLMGSPILDGWVVMLKQARRQLAEARHGGDVKQLFSTNKGVVPLRGNGPIRKCIVELTLNAANVKAVHDDAMNVDKYKGASLGLSKGGSSSSRGGGGGRSRNRGGGGKDGTGAEGSSKRGGGGAGKKSGGGGGAGSSRNRGGSSKKRPAKEKSKWVQCEEPSCLKWRKIPASVKDADLPEVFKCSMNRWDSARSNCAVPEEVVVAGEETVRVWVCVCVLVVVCVCEVVVAGEETVYV